MNQIDRKLVVLLLSCIFLLSGCIAPSTSVNDITIPGVANTLAAQTMAAKPAMSYQPSTPEAAQGASAPDSVSSSNTSPTFPTQTPIAFPTPQTALIIQNPLVPTVSGACVNAAEFIKDVTIPDNAAVKPGKAFLKVWQLKNVGTCAWNKKYSIVHVWGDQLNGASPTTLSQLVDPGSIVDVAIELVAPIVPGEYQGNWLLQDDAGDRFGTGYDAREQIWVAITSGFPNIPGLTLKSC